MGNDIVPKDLRYIDKVERSNKQTRIAKKNRKYRNKLKIRKELEERIEYEARRGEELSWGQNFKAQFNSEVNLAREKYVIFTQRTGRTIDFEALHGRIQRRGQKVLEVIEQMYPELGRTWLNLKPGRGRRPGINREKMRKLLGKLGVPYWNDMRSDEMRAVLFILVWFDKIDTEEYFWNKGDLG